MIMTDYNNPNTNWLPPGYDPYKGMDDHERLKAGCLQLATFIAMLIVGLLLCALMGSCTTTKYVTVERHTTDTLRLSRNIRDSIYLSDSIYVSDFVRDDTVIKTIERWHTQYRDRWKTDTIYQSKTDTLTNVYENVREVPAQLTWWQQARLHLANIMLWLLLVVSIIYIGKKHIGGLRQD